MKEIQVSPYAKIVIEEFKTAKEKLLAMNQEPGFNRMKVGECFNITVRFYIYRTGANSYEVESAVPIKYQGKDRKKFRNMTSDEVVNLISEHNILEHEMFEIPTRETFGQAGVEVR